MPDPDQAMPAPEAVALLSELSGYLLRIAAMTATRTVAVGVRSHEVPDATFVDCDLMVNGVAGTTQLLRELRDVSRPA